MGFKIFGGGGNKTTKQPSTEEKSVQYGDRKYFSCCKNSTLFFSSVMITGAALIVLGALSVASVYFTGYSFFAYLNTFTIKAAEVLSTDPMMIVLLESFLGVALIGGGLLAYKDFGRDPEIA